MAEVDGDRNTFNLFEAVQVYYAQSVLVVRHHVTSGIGHIDFAVQYLQLVGLESHQAGVHHFKCGRVYFSHIAPLLVVRVDYNGTGVGGCVSVRAVKADKTHIGDVYLAYAACRGGIHDFYLVGAVYDGVHTGTVDL